MSWFRREPRLTREAVAQLEPVFDKWLAKTKAATPEEFAAISYGVAFGWRMFLVEFGSTENFLKQSGTDKAKYNEKLREFHSKIAEAKFDELVEYGMFLFITFYTALWAYSDKMIDAATLNRMSDQLEPFNKKGSALQGLFVPPHTS